ncbi:MAG: hypothetical protein KatS3mg109_1814 [Pirellulaceae bacterium]|nr:MAG: hypothetical protein KatS3mg109_1814 [Pirellulaceae bacterium]
MLTTENLTTTPQPTAQLEAKGHLLICDYSGQEEYQVVLVPEAMGPDDIRLSRLWYYLI